MPLNINTVLSLLRLKCCSCSDGLFDPELTEIYSQTHYSRKEIIKIIILLQNEQLPKCFILQTSADSYAILMLNNSNAVFVCEEKDRAVFRDFAPAIKRKFSSINLSITPIPAANKEIFFTETISQFLRRGARAPAINEREIQSFYFDKVIESLETKISQNIDVKRKFVILVKYELLRRKRSEFSETNLDIAKRISAEDRRHKISCYMANVENNLNEALKLLPLSFLLACHETTNLDELLDDACCDGCQTVKKWEVDLREHINVMESQSQQNHYWNKFKNVCSSIYGFARKTVEKAIFNPLSQFGKFIFTYAGNKVCEYAEIESPTIAKLFSGTGYAVGLLFYCYDGISTVVLFCLSQAIAEQIFLWANDLNIDDASATVGLKMRPFASAQNCHLLTSSTAAVGQSLFSQSCFPMLALGCSYGSSRLLTTTAKYFVPELSAPMPTEGQQFLLLSLSQAGMFAGRQILKAGVWGRKIYTQRERCLAMQNGFVNEFAEDERVALAEATCRFPYARINLELLRRNHLAHSMDCEIIPIENELWARCNETTTMGPFLGG